MDSEQHRPASRTFEDLGWSQLLDHLARRCHTLRGAEAAAELDLFDDPDDARRHLAEVSEARALADGGVPLAFGGIESILGLLARADKGGVLEGEELIAVANTGRGLHRLRRHLLEHRTLAPLLAETSGDIEDLSHVYEPILDSFDAEGRLADHASERLGQLRRNAARLQGKLESRARAMVDDAKISPHLQDRFWTQRDDRYVLPIRVESQSAVKGIVHGTSGSGQTVFVEPHELVELNNQLKLAECEVADEERRILEALTGRVVDAGDALRRAVDAGTQIDLVSAAARLSEVLGGAPAEIVPAGIDLRTARHPLMVLSDRSCVPNDIRLAAGTILIVSGPNAGGKTVALKTAGLAAMMTRAGLHIAADPGSQIAWFEEVRTDIGDSQSIEQDLSTFTAHLVNLRACLAEATERSLLLIDEVAAGTDPEQGAALAQAILEALVCRGVPAIVTTHYERLKVLAASDQRFASASVGFDFDEMVPTFRLHLGHPGSSGALHVARRLGLAEGVTQRAEQLLGEGRAGIDELLANLSDAQRELEQLRSAVELERDEARRAQRRAEQAEQRARERQREAHVAAHNEAVIALREARTALDRARSSIKSGARDRDLSADRRAIDRLGASVAKNAPAADPVRGDVARLEDLVPGAGVIVRHLGEAARGTVVSTDRGKVTVQVGALRTTASVGDLVMDRSRAGKPGTGRPTTPPNRRVKSSPRDSEQMAPVRSPDATIDVRGERAHEAVAALDRFIDRSLLANREVVFVIHGHGTGALRRAVREHLGDHPSVTQSRGGEPSEGGDGVTLAWLDS